MRHPEIHAVFDGLLDAGAVHRLPELPNFGIFYLDIPTAAVLIVDDLRRSGIRATFGVEESGDETGAEREKRFVKRIAQLFELPASNLLALAEKHQAKNHPREP